ncbi:MAG: tripartite tricarboxylate transporter substrate binding protein [Pseudolabrys sp.]|nr:tripartite tricarboxylate transporter substrate binding protein [Pseudolabrys sp.]
MRLSRRTGLAAATAFVAAAALCGGTPRGALAQDWPSRSITIVIPFTGGGMMDFAVRSVAQELTRALGQTALVEPKPGGSGAVGTTAVARAEPDGYTLLITAIGPVVFRPLMDKNAGPDVGRDMTPIVMIGDTPNGILASPKLGVGTVKELIAYAKSHDNRLTIGHPGVGTMGELCGMLLAQKIGVDGNMIAYRGATPIISDLLGGQIDIGTPAYGPGADAVKILAVSGDQRLPSLPTVPTLKESGVDMECSTWLAIFGPANMPRPIVDRLNATIDGYLRKPETREAFSKIGLRVLGGPPERLRDRVVADRALWSPIVLGRPEAAK